MGRGNWFPGSNLNDCEVCYLDYSDDSIDCDDYDLHQWRWDDCKQSILDCLPESFIAVDSLRELPNYCRTVNDRYSVPIAFNSLYTIWIDSQGESYHQGIGITVNENAPGFARANMGKIWARFIDRLADRYVISLRSCAWTSHKYTKLTTIKETNNYDNSTSYTIQIHAAFARCQAIKRPNAQRRTGGNP